MPDVAIIADDLTGALDAAAPFAMRGIPTAAVLGPDGLDEALASGARVISISTDSREIEPEEAKARVAAAFTALPQCVRLFKKIDSRLKGNIAAELAALPHRRSLVAPAIPSFGRLVRNGHVTGFGVAAPIPIREALGPFAPFATIPDTDSQADIVAALDGSHDLYVGARGLAEALAGEMAGEALPPPAYPRRPAVVVIGSTDPITLAQAEALRAAVPGLACLRAPNGRIDPSCGPATAEFTLLQATQGDRATSARDVEQALADSLKKLEPSPGTLLVLSGGATAQAILGSLGVRMLQVLGEALPGLPVSRAGSLTVVSKSGGFGAPDTLVRLLSPAIQEPDRA